MATASRLAPVSLSNLIADPWRVIDLRIVLGAVSSRPLAADRAAALLTGEEMSDERIAAVAGAAAEIAKPMDNTDFELVWRKKMVRSLLSHALHEIRGDDMTAPRRQLARQELLSIPASSSAAR